MPEPDWAESGLESLERPQANLEILGRGAGARKSKTFFRDQEIATLLGFIRGHVRRLMELFRRLHARHFTVEIEEEVEQEQPDGTIKKVKVKRVVDEVLTDDQIRDLYPIVAEWERMHQEQVDHYASIGGFSVRAASGMGDDVDSKGRSESSAGTDRRAKTGAAKVSGTEPKWR